MIHTKILSELQDSLSTSSLHRNVCSFFSSAYVLHVFRYLYLSYMVSPFHPTQIKWSPWRKVGSCSCTISSWAFELGWNHAKLCKIKGTLFICLSYLQERNLCNRLGAPRYILTHWVWIKWHLHAPSWPYECWQHCVFVVSPAKWNHTNVRKNGILHQRLRKS